jgi:hypothetical protein
MNKYKVILSRPIYHNGVFSHNGIREQIVHANSIQEAEKFVLPNSAEVIICTGLTIDIGMERIVGCVGIKCNLQHKEF